MHHFSTKLSTPELCQRVKVPLCFVLPWWIFTWLQHLFEISETRWRNLWQLLRVNGSVHKNLHADSQRRIKNSSLLIIFIYADTAAIFLSRIGTTVGTKEQRGDGKEELILSEDLTSGIGLSWQMTSINEGLAPRFIWRQRFLPKMWLVEWQLDRT